MDGMDNDDPPPAAFLLIPFIPNLTFQGFQGCRTVRCGEPAFVRAARSRLARRTG